MLFNTDLGYLLTKIQAAVWHKKDYMRSS